MKVLILGGTRYMGYEAARFLLELGHQVVTVSRSEVEHKNWKHKICNRKDYDSLFSLIRDEQPEQVIDMICFDENDAIGVAQLGKSGVLECVRHYVMVSSFFLYNYFDQREDVFNGDVRVISDGYTKRKAEAELEIYHGDIFQKSSIVRLPYVFSHDDYSGRFQKFCEIAIGGGWSDLTLKTSMIAMKDAARGLSEIVLESPLGFVDVSNEGCMSLTEISDLVRVSIGDRISPSSTMLFQNPYPLKKNICLNSRKIKAMRPLSIAIEEESCAWWAANKRPL